MPKSSPCIKCRKRPRRTRQRWCGSCFTAYMKDWRAGKKAETERLHKTVARLHRTIAKQAKKLTDMPAIPSED